MLAIRCAKGQVIFGITNIPGRKNKCLYTSNEKGIQLLAYFKSDAKADEFQRVMDFIFDAISVREVKDYGQKSIYNNKQT